MAATVVTLIDFGGHSPVAGFFKCNPSNIYAAFYSNSTDTCAGGPSVLAELHV